MPISSLSQITEEGENKRHYQKSVKSYPERSSQKVNKKWVGPVKESKSDAHKKFINNGIKEGTYDQNHRVFSFHFADNVAQNKCGYP